ncbi:hypothetical protein [Methanospirillum hungatei]|uniref:hypothetical protein n=1 Tax=Methanospirillum hungatei TaxID=2203 RepID=UPI0026E9D1FF|nr:hypothetical protein [Methanospirillum hungatei]MCA1917057.1 hypothetical protein [Methanospirillum hungatei]
MVHLKIVRYGLIPGLMLLLLCIPVSAAIDLTSSSVFDAGGQTPAFGEEILTTVIVRPGPYDVEDLKIVFNEKDGLIDPLSFGKSLYPIGTQANITVENNVLFCDHLKAGEELTITFYAYPKTTQKSMITPVQMQISYIQLGQKISEQKQVITVMDQAAWHILQTNRTSTNNTGILLILAALGIAIVIILILIVKMKDMNVQNTSKKIVFRDMSILREIKRRLDEIENPSTSIIDLQHYVKSEMDKIDNNKNEKNNSNNSGSLKNGNTDGEKKIKPTKKGDKF